ncbi:MAG TPA: hypothetical protein VN634_10400 [Candidatus Limnocylindrales bacterium]|nr:hypothetical protein [Candidatus Limnocylindrales bacterium]
MAAMLATLWPIPLTFKIKAETESLTIQTAQTLFPLWNFSNAVISDYEGNEEIFTGPIQFRPDVEILVNRIGHGPLMIRARCTGTESSVGEKFDENSTVDRLPPEIVVRVDEAILTRSNESFVFPVVGQIKLGSQTSYGGSSPLLKEGKLSLLCPTLVGRSRFESTSVDLDPGEDVEIDDASGPSFGLIFVDERPGLNASYSTAGGEARIKRFGSQGYAVQGSLLDRIANDPVLRSFWAATVALLGWATWWKKDSNS